MEKSNQSEVSKLRQTQANKLVIIISADGPNLLKLRQIFSIIPENYDAEKRFSFVQRRPTV